MPEGFALPGKRVVLIRHGESEDNVIADRVMEQMLRRQMTREEGVRTYLRERKVDPALTDIGTSQAAALGRHWAPAIEGLAARSEVVVICGPMLRNLQTLQQMRKSLQGMPLRYVCHRDVYELQGLVSKSDDSYRGLTPEQIQAEYDVELHGFHGNPAKQWSDGSLEQLSTQEARVQRIADWLREEARENPKRSHVVVGHGELFGKLLTVLLALQIDSEGPKAVSVRYRPFTLRNTGVTSLRLLRQRSGHVACTVDGYDDVSHLHPLKPRL